MLHRLYFDCPWPERLWDRTSWQYFDLASVQLESVGVPRAGLADRDLLRLSGAPRGSAVQVVHKRFNDEVCVHNDALFEAPFLFSVRREDGALTARLQSLRLKDMYRKKGIGARMFILMVRAARGMGVQSLMGQGLGDALPESRVWDGALPAAVLGWDAELPPEYIASLPDFLHVETLRELMLHPGGRDWWARHPTPLRLTFDTSTDSTGMRLLRSYAFRSRIRVHQ